jgi:hypothetical protein
MPKYDAPKLCFQRCPLFPSNCGESNIRRAINKPPWTLRLLGRLLKPSAVLNGWRFAGDECIDEASP